MKSLSKSFFITTVTIYGCTGLEHLPTNVNAQQLPAQPPIHRTEVDTRGSQESNKVEYFRQKLSSLLEAINSEPAAAKIAVQSARIDTSREPSEFVFVLENLDTSDEASVGLTDSTFPDVIRDFRHSLGSQQLDKFGPQTDQLDLADDEETEILLDLHKLALKLQKWRAKHADPPLEESTSESAEIFGSGRNQFQGNNMYGGGGGGGFPPMPYQMPFPGYPPYPPQFHPYYGYYQSTPPNLIDSLGLALNGPRYPEDRGRPSLLQSLLGRGDKFEFLRGLADVLIGSKLSKFGII